MHARCAEGRGVPVTPRQAGSGTLRSAFLGRRVTPAGIRCPGSGWGQSPCRVSGPGRVRGRRP